MKHLSKKRRLVLVAWFQLSALVATVPLAARAQTADLSVTKTASASQVSAGDTLTYTITVSNAGPDEATGVTVTDTLSADVLFVSAPGCTYEGASATVACSIGTLAAGNQQQVTVTTTVRQDAPKAEAHQWIYAVQTLAGTVSLYQYDPDNGATEIAATTAVDPPTGVGIDPSGTTGYLVVGRKILSVDIASGSTSVLLPDDWDLANFRTWDLDDLVIDPGGDLLVSASSQSVSGGQILRVNPVSGAVTRLALTGELLGAPGPLGLALGSAGTTLYVADAGFRQIAEIDLGTGVVTRILYAGDAVIPERLDVEADGNLVACYRDDGLYRIDPGVGSSTKIANIGFMQPIESCREVVVDRNSDLLIAGWSPIGFTGVHRLLPSGSAYDPSRDVMLSPGPTDLTLAPAAVINRVQVQSATTDPVSSNDTATHTAKLVTVVPVAVAGVMDSSSGRGETLDVTVNGTNLGNVTSLSFGAGVTVNTFTPAPSQIQANITVACDAALGPRDVTVDGPDGGATGEGVFTVVLGAPKITGIVPPSAHRGTAGLLMDIEGCNLDEITVPGRVTFSGTGITVNSISSTSPTLVSAMITIADDAPLGTRDVTVTDATNRSDTKQMGFEVTLGPPTILSVSPNEAAQGDSLLEVVVSGDNLDQISGFEVTLDGQPAGVSIMDGPLVVGGTVYAYINVAADAPLGPRDVTVSGPNGTATSPGAFTVKLGRPTLTGVIPPQATRGGGPFDLTITGTNLDLVDSIDEVTFLGTGITINSVATPSSTQVTVNVTIPLTAPLGKRGVKVTPENADPANETYLLDAFEVVASPPQITSITPSSLEQGQSGVIRIEGTELDSKVLPTAVSFGTIDVSAGSVTVVSPLRLDVNVSVASTATVGPRDVTVTTDAGSTTATGGFTVTSPQSADVSITKTASPAAAQPGDTVTYTLTVRNNGPDDARSLIVNDPLPPDLQFVSATSPCQFEAPALVSCALGDLGATAQVQLTIQAQVRPGAPTQPARQWYVTGLEAGVVPPRGGLWRIKGDGSIEKVFTDAGIINPRGVAIAPSGIAYVCSHDGQGGGRIYRIDTVAGTGSLLTSFEGHNATDVVIRSNGKLLVSAYQQTAEGYVGRIFEVDPATGLATDVTPFAQSLAYPHALARETDGNLIVADTDGSMGDHLVRVHFVLGSIFEITKASAPTGVAVERDGNVVSALSGTGISRYDLQSSEWGPVAQLSDDPRFQSVAHVEVDYGGDLVVADPNASSVHAFDPASGALKISRDLSSAVLSPHGVALSGPEIINSAFVQTLSTDPLPSNNNAAARVAVGAQLPAPTITGVDPSSGLQGATLDVLIAGTNLEHVTSITFGSGITVNSIASVSATPPGLVANVSIAPDATVAPRDVTVIGLGGSATAPGAFSVTSTQAADVSVTKAVSPAVALRGQTVTYTLTVRNDGPNPAQWVVVDDLLPADVEFVSATSPCRLEASQSVSCALGDLASGSQQELVIEGRVRADAPTQAAREWFVTGAAAGASPARGGLWRIKSDGSVEEVFTDEGIVNARGVAVDRNGIAYLCSHDGQGNGRVFKVDTSTGAGSVLTSFEDHNATDVVVQANGKLLVSGWFDTIFGYLGRIFEVDPDTGAATGLALTGDLLAYPHALAQEADGKLVVADTNGILGDHLVRVDPVTGQASELTKKFAPLGVAVERGGTLVSTFVEGAVERYDLQSGNWTTIAFFPAQSLAHLAVDNNDDLIVVDQDATAVQVLDPVSGTVKLSRDISSLVDSPHGVALSPAEITNSATVQTLSTDPTPANNSSTAVVVIPRGLPPPTITGVDPSSGFQGATLDVLITGTNLEHITSVTFGSGVTVNSVATTGVTPAELVVNISIAADAPPGSRAVSVGGSGGTASLDGAFTVIATVVITVDDTIAVNDDATVMGPVVIAVDDTIAVSDDVSVERPPLVVMVDESITVSDAVAGVGAMLVAVQETVTVADAVAARGATVIEVDERVTVSDRVAVNKQSVGLVDPNLGGTIRSPDNEVVFAVAGGSLQSSTPVTVTITNTEEYPAFDPSLGLGWWVTTSFLFEPSGTQFSPPAIACFKVPGDVLACDTLLGFKDEDGNGVFEDAQQTASCTQPTGGPTTVCIEVGSFSSFAVAFVQGCELAVAPVRYAEGGLEPVHGHEIFEGPCGQAMADGTWVSRLATVPEVACLRSQATGDLIHLTGLEIVDESGHLRYQAVGSGAFCLSAGGPDGGVRPPGEAGGGGGGCSAAPGGGLVAAFFLLVAMAWLARRRRRGW